MAALVKKLSTGDVMVFDREKRDLYLVSQTHASSLDLNSPQVLNKARELATKGNAQHMNKHALGTLQQALAHVVLLGGAE